jgi:hypothetical protein
MASRSSCRVSPRQAPPASPKVMATCSPGLWAIVGPGAIWRVGPHGTPHRQASIGHQVIGDLIDNLPWHVCVS